MEILLFIVIVIQQIAVIIMAYFLMSRASINQPIQFFPKEEKKKVVGHFETIDLPTADELEEENKPAPVKEAEDAMRSLFKKLTNR